MKTALRILLLALVSGASIPVTGNCSAMPCCRPSSYSQAPAEKSFRADPACCKKCAYAPAQAADYLTTEKTGVRHEKKILNLAFSADLVSPSRQPSHALQGRDPPDSPALILSSSLSSRSPPLA
jgi:hypothetical protein